MSETSTNTVKYYSMQTMDTTVPVKIDGKVCPNVGIVILQCNVYNDDKAQQQLCNINNASIWL